MSRVQLALNVDDLDTAIAFYSKLFGTGRPGQARLRQLRRRRAAPETRAAGEPRPGRHAQPPRVEVESSEQVHGGSPGWPVRAVHRGELSSTCWLRQAGQGVGHRSRRRAVGGHHVLADSETFFDPIPVESAASAPGGCCGS